MATYTTLQIGSKGDDVKKLQQKLGITADGIYGNQTASAVKAYQKANGLSVDGIAGNQTLGSLYGGNNSKTSNTTTTPKATTAVSTSPAIKSEADVAKETKYNKYNEILDQKPGDFTSDYTEAAKQAMEKYLNRDKFTYDLNGDALYQQYKDQYINQGKLAMQDTIGQAAAMTGGYGNSYAQSVGQQTYQGYLQQLNDKVPELYQLALDQYNQEGESMLNQYGLLADRENTEYGRYRDEVSDYNTEKGFAYNEYRDAVSDSQWQTQFDETVKNADRDYELAVRQIEENERHNLISEDQAQQQINQAAAELTAKYITAGYRKDKDGNWVKAEEEEEDDDDDEKGYSDWDASDWESYFAQIRQSEGKSAAEEELQYFTSNGLIPKNMVTYGAIGARGSSRGH